MGAPIPPIPQGAIVITIPVPLPQLPPLPVPAIQIVSPGPPAFPGGVPGGSGPQNYSGGPAGGVVFPPAPAAGVCGFGLPSPIEIKLIIPLPTIKFPPDIPFPYIALKLTCDLSKPVDITTGLKMPYGGGRANNAGPDADNFPNAA